MPTIKQFSNCTVVMYSADHLPPHFHVRMNDGREALVRISDSTILTGRVERREITDVLAWAAAEKWQLIDKWQELNT